MKKRILFSVIILIVCFLSGCELYDEKPTVSFILEESSYAGASSNNERDLSGLTETASNTQKAIENNYYSVESEIASKRENTDLVYKTPTGKCYHFLKTCGGKNSTETTLDKALSDGLTPCKRCVR